MLPNFYARPGILVLALFANCVFFPRLGCAGEVELRAGYGLTGSAPLGALTDSSLVTASGKGIVLSALLTGPDSLFSFGLQYEQLSSNPAGGLAATFRRIAFLLEKEFTWDAFFLSPGITVGFLNTAHYGEPGRELWRASTPLTLSAGLGAGLRFSWVGVFCEGGYRWARLDQSNNSVSGDDVSGQFRPNWSAPYFRSYLVFWL